MICTICKSSRHVAASCPRRRRGLWLPALALALLLPGCSTFGAEKTTVTDTFCINVQKRSWSINDSPESIRAAESWNRAIDKRCGVGNVAAS